MAFHSHRFLGGSSSEGSDHDEGYNSEAAEPSKGGPTAKRRKLSPPSAKSEHEETWRGSPNKGFRFDDGGSDGEGDHQDGSALRRAAGGVSQEQGGDGHVDRSTVPTLSPNTRKRSGDKVAKSRPGVIYLSSLPPYLRPSALRNLLTQRGFGPITRLFLTPASKASSSSKKNSRQLYTEGWIEFASKKVAKACAETLNASSIGGKKGGFYRDDVWNMKYLKGMGWEELMAGVREERREEEGRRDEERRIIAGEAKRFVEGVEKSKRDEGMKSKRKKGRNKPDEVGRVEDPKRTWRQFEVMRTDTNHKQKPKHQRESIEAEDFKAVLANIF